MPPTNPHRPSKPQGMDGALCPTCHYLARMTGFWPKDVKDASGHLIRELHGVTLAQILEYLVARMGWEALAAEIKLNCFAVNPSVKSSLVFLRRTPWARTKVEQLYVEVRTEEELAKGT
jgi:hypothetical protein